jgi:hypothetical protein
LAICLRLAAADPADIDIQRNLSVSYDRLGQLAAAAGETDQAREWFDQALAIDLRLAAADPDNPEFQRNLTISYGRLETLAEQTGRPTGPDTGPPAPPQPRRGWLSRVFGN